MAKARSLVGLDVHAVKIVAAVLDGDTGELEVFVMNGENASAAAFCAGLPGPVRVAYEAGPTEYALARELAKRGVECVVAGETPAFTMSRNSRPLTTELVACVLSGSVNWQELVQVGWQRRPRGRRRPRCRSRCTGSWELEGELTPDRRLPRQPSANRRPGA